MTGDPCDGRRGLRPAARRRLRRVDVRAARAGAAVIENLVAGVLALALIVYLAVVLVRPEQF
jgi:K+-transporting ATPase KdpF subunit